MPFVFSDGTRPHSNTLCGCGHRASDHYQGTGQCHDTGHANAGACGCTWYWPNDKYIKRKTREKANQEKSK